MLRFDGKKDAERRRVLEQGGQVGLIAEGDTEIVSMIPSFGEYRKTSTTFAVRMDDPFEVDTLEGVMLGKAGDFLAVGQAGELYPIAAEVFAVTYELVDDQ